MLLNSSKQTIGEKKIISKKGERHKIILDKLYYYYGWYFSNVLIIKNSELK